MHGGRIEAFSAGPGKGSEFRVALPAVRGSGDGADVAPATAIREPAQARHRGLILIADDNVDAGWGIAKLLDEIAGFSTVRVKGGVEAVKKMRRQKPDVGIVDIGMPDLSGHEVARQIRQTEWGKRMVLIAATGWVPCCKCRTSPRAKAAEDIASRRPGAARALFAGIYRAAAPALCFSRVRAHRRLTL